MGKMERMQVFFEVSRRVCGFAAGDGLLCDCMDYLEANYGEMLAALEDGDPAPVDWSEMVADLAQWLDGGDPVPEGAGFLFAAPRRITQHARARELAA